jgi:peptidoglycan/xylan/chitin deacetylase (PgdA/CDA1 family)
MTFAYPNGAAADFDDRAKRLVRDLGVRVSVTTESGFARPDHDAYALPRVYSSERYLPLFAARLSGLGREVA